MGFIHREASAVIADLVGGLEGFGSTLNFSIELLEDELVEERLMCIFKYAKQNMLPLKALSIALRCVPVDCEYLDRCCLSEATKYDTLASHFEIPAIVDIPNAVSFIGSTDMLTEFAVYTNKTYKSHKYKMRGSKKPFVFIDTNLNKNGMMDCFIFGAPMLERVTVSAIFRDLRQVEEYMSEFGCCPMEETYSPTFIDTEAKALLLNKKFKYYRQAPALPQPNQQNPGQ